MRPSATRCAAIALLLLPAAAIPVAAQAPALLAAGGAYGEPTGDAPGSEAPADAPGPASLAEALTELDRATNRRGRVGAELAGLVHERDNARSRMRSRLRSLYRMRRAGVLPLAGGLDALLSHQSRVQRLERMVVRDASAVEDLRRRVGALRSESSRLAGALEAQERRVAAFRAAEEAQQRQLDVLATMMQDPEAFAGAGASGASPEGGASGFGLRVLGEPAPARGLAAEHGRLPLPVGGSARLSDDAREGGAGLAFAATAGVSVRAVFMGRVAYAAVHPAYGRLVILDHADGHYTVYGSLGAIGVTVGQMVSRDTVLGTVGAEPMFFQVRRGTRPLEARGWLGL